MRKLLVLFFAASILTACGAPAATPTTAPTQPGLTAPATSAPNETPTAASASTPVPSDTPAATVAPTAAPTPAIIGLDNFAGLVQLHTYAPDLASSVSQPGFGLTAPVFSPDSKTFVPLGSYTLASGNRALFIMDVATGKQVSSVPLGDSDRLSDLAFSPDGQYLLYAIYPKGQLVVWDIATQKVDRVLFSKKGDFITDLGFTSDGKQVTAATGGANSKGAGDTLLVLDFASGSLVTQFPIDRQYGLDIGRFSADGSRLVVSDQKNGKRLSVYDTSTWKKISTIAPPTGAAAEVVAISPDGAHIVTSKQGGGPILVWDAATGEQVSTFNTPFDDTADMEFNHDGSMLVVTGTPPFKPKTDNMYLTAAFWDTSTWQQVGIQHWNNTQDLRFAPDGKSLLIVPNSGLDLYLIGFPDQSFQASSQAVSEFTTALSKGDYAAAASLLYLLPTVQDAYKSKGLISDPAAMLEAICTRKAFPCLPVKVIYAENYGPSNGGTSYVSLVQFTNPDGSTYANQDGATLFTIYSEEGPDGSFKVDLPDVPDDILKK